MLQKAFAFPKALFTIPSFQNPTCCALDKATAAAVYNICRCYDLIIIEVGGTDSNYLFCSTRLLREDAEADCLDRGMDLVKIDNAEENNFLFSQIVAVTTWGHPGPWIGLQDKDLDGTFAWNDGSALGEDAWCSTNPVDPGGRKYVNMEISIDESPCWADSGSWDTAELEYICEEEADADTDELDTLFLVVGRLDSFCCGMVWCCVCFVPGSFNLQRGLRPRRRRGRRPHEMQDALMMFALLVPSMFYHCLENSNGVVVVV